MKLAIATAATYPRGILDTPVMIETFINSGIEASLQVWDDPAVNWHLFDAVLLHSTWDYTHKYKKFIDWCGKISKTSRLINSVDIVKSNSTKHYLLALQDKGVAIPKSLLVKSKQSVKLDTLQANFSGSVVVKPVIDVGGEKAKLFGNVAESFGYIIELSKTDDVLVQEFVSEVVKKGEQSAIMIGGRLSHTVRRIPASEEFRVDDELGGSIVVEKATPELEAFCLDILRKLNRNPVYARIDFIDSKKTRLLMEAEMIEPQLFLRFAPESCQRFADEILKTLSSN
jgi:glutathione synthase/RimK-type ligase-like ATP-grasp enzyme